MRSGWLDCGVSGGNRITPHTKKWPFDHRVGISMGAFLMPQTEEQLLRDLQTTDEPTEFLSDLFDSVNHKDDMRLRRYLRNLSALGYINIPM